MLAGFEFMRAFQHKAPRVVQIFPAIVMSYIRHKILLTLCRPTPTLLVEQGFAGCATHF
ncbi:hypothetical protein PSAB6_160041 [Paraburkholderia sabiae]|nr:hypothetical protein PSAB6_160041 [Paraburkholderia sabiae]